jgi:hypothetical protein
MITCGKESGKIKSFFMILTKKLLSDEKIIKNCSNRFRNGDFRLEKTAGMEVTQIRRGKLLLLLLLFLAEKKVGKSYIFNDSNQKNC